MRALTLALLLAATPALAQQNCGPVSGLAGHLKGKTGVVERPLLRGLAQRNIVELWGDPASGQWTLVEISSHGQACIIGAGIGLEPIANEPEGEPS